jgi:hypothetical protein
MVLILSKSSDIFLNIRLNRAKPVYHLILKLNSMANVYTAYTKTVQDKVHYFVKRFQTFPDLKNVPPVQESFGMHTDFDKACSIASIFDPKIKAQILDELNNNAPQAKVIGFGNVHFAEKKVAQ